MLYFFGYILELKIHSRASAYFSVRFSVKLKLPTIIGDVRVKIISQTLKLKLITNWRA